MGTVEPLVHRDEDGRVGRVGCPREIGRAQQPAQPKDHIPY